MVLFVAGAGLVMAGTAAEGSPAGPGDGAPSDSGCGVAVWSTGTRGATVRTPGIPSLRALVVRNPANGHTVTVVSRLRGRRIPGHLIDLPRPAFVVLAPLGQGRLRVCVSW